jgi:hypothetical protein
MNTLVQDQEAAAASLAPAVRNPRKLETLQPGQGAEGRKKCTRSFASKLRRFLESGTKTAADHEGRTRLRQIFDTLLQIATDGGHPQCVNAARLLLERGYGKPQSADEDLEAIKKGGLTLVYVNRPEIDPEIPIAQPALPAPEPEFIDG